MINKIVYSTEFGKMVTDTMITDDCTKNYDGIVRIQLQTKGRKGKGVCIISGLNLPKPDLMTLAAELKKQCGCGGAVKEDKIEIQGNNRELLKKIIENHGYKVKFSGG